LSLNRVSKVDIQVFAFLTHRERYRLSFGLQRVTSASTKVRRLGYFVLFSRILGKDPVPRLVLQQRVIDEKSGNRELLEEACRELPVKRAKSEHVTGEICTEDAFRRYLETAISFRLVQELSGRLYNTKRGEILQALNQGENAFKLNLSQSCLLLRAISEKDYDYTRTVIESSSKNGPDEHVTFFSNVKEIWKQKLARIEHRNIKEYDDLKKAIGTKWDKAKSYYSEDIRSPRLEWLLDLKVIEFWNMRKNRVTFRANPEKLLDNEGNSSKTFVSYMRPLLSSSVVYWNEMPLLKRKSMLESLLKQSFTFFKADPALRKISVNQLLEYGVSLLSGSGIVCEIGDLDDELEQFIKSRSEKYRYVRIISEADRGYISEF
jgi:hypothetical protein